METKSCINREWHLNVIMQYDLLLPSRLEIYSRQVTVL